MKIVLIERKMEDREKLEIPCITASEKNKEKNVLFLPWRWEKEVIKVKSKQILKKYKGKTWKKNKNYR